MRKDFVNEVAKLQKVLVLLLTVRIRRDSKNSPPFSKVSL